MKLSDFVIDYLVQKGIRVGFFISGGAAVHLVDSADRHPQMRVICNQHEQYSGTAADGYARITGLGLAMVTSGPGATNLLTAISNCYFDSTPCIFLTGQVATFRLRKNNLLRQKGFQETPVIQIYHAVTKYAVQITNGADIKYELQKAIYFATSGRKGPVVIDIPDDIQRAEIDPIKLRQFSPPKPKFLSLQTSTKQLLTYLHNAKRPVVIAGAGVSLAQTRNEFVNFIERFHLPVVLSWGGADLLPHTHTLNMGVIGVCGPRGGNFAVQNADLILAVGTRLSQLITGGKQNLFAPHAKKIMVDIDPAELTKFTADTFTLDLAIETDLKLFFEKMLFNSHISQSNSIKTWHHQIKQWVKMYPICPAEHYKQQKNINPYVFVKEFSKLCKKNAIIFADTGANLSWTMQTFEVKKGQRIYSAWNQTPMGFSLPASVGATFATKKEVICFIGDGGLMMSLAELETVKFHHLPIKIFIFNNHGHSIQKQTMDTWLNSRYVAADTKSGLSFPNFNKVGRAFGLPIIHIKTHRELQSKIKKALTHQGPVLVNVEITPGYRITPMLKFGAGLEDLDPKIPKEELMQIMSTSKS